MELTLVIFAIFAAAAAGYYVGNNFSQGSQEKERLASELKEKQQELEAFRNKVTNHFEKTADLFNHVSDSYQSLYDHMATSSSQLCSTPSFRAIPSEEKPARSILSETSNPVKEEVFNADNFYKAHDYRNQAEIEADEKAAALATNDSANIVDIESAKDDRNEPALDYAIKEAGVVNHNSLEIEGVKNSQ